MIYRYPDEVRVGRRRKVLMTRVGVGLAVAVFAPVLFMVFSVPRGNVPWPFIFLAAIPWLASLWIAYANLKALRKNEPLLALNAHAMDVFMGSPPWGRIYWHEIRDVSQRTRVYSSGRSIKFLMIHLKDPRRFYRLGGAFWRFKRSMDGSLGGSSISLRTVDMDMPVKEIVTTAKAYRDAAQ